MYTKYNPKAHDFLYSGACGGCGTWNREIGFVSPTDFPPKLYKEFVKIRSDVCRQAFLERHHLNHIVRRENDCTECRETLEKFRKEAADRMDVENETWPYLLDWQKAAQDLVDDLERKLCIA